jgi:hypothetical protein
MRGAVRFLLGYEALEVLVKAPDEVSVVKCCVDHGVDGGHDHVCAARAVGQRKSLVLAGFGQIANEPCVGVLECVQRLVIVAGDQHLALGGEQLDERVLHLGEVLILVNDDERIHREVPRARLEVAQAAIDDIGVRDRVVVARESQCLANGPVGLVERMHRALDARLRPIVAQGS